MEGSRNDIQTAGSLPGCSLDRSRNRVFQRSRHSCFRATRRGFEEFGTKSLLSAVRNCSDMLAPPGLSSFPPKRESRLFGSIRIATLGLDARLRGHDGCNFHTVSIKIRHRNYESQYLAKTHFD